ncbi:hypothetical protein WJX72_008772 [[Myrmecia] bisecta]|uniref:FHA domain-containing protein n=1 Tax=[Myrmecia] bisecta TaxID=41462 RepID=A0AAW1Q0Z4_9CHLO
MMAHYMLKAVSPLACEYQGPCGPHILLGTDTIEIGRRVAQSNKAVKLPHAWGAVSGLHMIIHRDSTKEPYAFFLEDRSTNGTWIDEEKAPKGQRVPLPLGCRVRLSVVPAAQTTSATHLEYHFVKEELTPDCIAILRSGSAKRKLSTPEGRAESSNASAKRAKQDADGQRRSPADQEQYEKVIARLNESNQEYKSKLSTQRAQLDVLERQLREQKAAHAAELKAADVARQKQQDQSRQEVATATEALKGAQALAAQQEKRAGEAEERLRSHEEAHSRVEQELATLRDQRSNLEAKESRAAEQLQSAEAQLAGLRTDLQGLQQRHDALQQQSAQAGRDLAAANQEAERLRESERGLTQKHAALQKAHEQQAQVLRGREEAFRRQDEQLQAQSATRAKAEAASKKLEEALSAAQAEAAAAHKAQQGGQAVQQGLRRRLAETQQALEAAQRVAEEQRVAAQQAQRAAEEARDNERSARDHEMQLDLKVAQQAAKQHAAAQLYKVAADYLSKAAQTLGPNEGLAEQERDGETQRQGSGARTVTYEATQQPEPASSVPLEADILAATQQVSQMLEHGMSPLRGRAPQPEHSQTLSGRNSHAMVTGSGTGAAPADGAAAAAANGYANGCPTSRPRQAGAMGATETQATDQEGISQETPSPGATKTKRPRTGRGRRISNNASPKLQQQLPQSQQQQAQLAGDGSLKGQPPAVINDSQPEGLGSGSLRLNLTLGSKVGLDLPPDTAEFEGMN